MEVGEVVVVVLVEFDQLRAPIRTTAARTPDRSLGLDGLDHSGDGLGRGGRSRPPQRPHRKPVLARPRGAASPVPPMVVRARAPPRSLGLYPVDRPAAPPHEVADQLAPAQLSPDHARTRRRRVLRENARRSLAPRAQSRPPRRHPLPRPAAHLRDTPAVEERQPEGRLRDARARQHSHHARHLLLHVLPDMQEKAAKALEEALR